MQKKNKHFGAISDTPRPTTARKARARDAHQSQQICACIQARRHIEESMSVAGIFMCVTEITTKPTEKLSSELKKLSSEQKNFSSELNSTFSALNFPASLAPSTGSDAANPKAAQVSALSLGAKATYPSLQNAATQRETARPARRFETKKCNIIMQNKLFCVNLNLKC